MMKKKKTYNEKEYLQSRLLQVVWSSVDFTLQQWAVKLKTEDGRIPSVSSVSEWKRGEREMGAEYRHVFVRSLICDPDILQYQSQIRNNMMEELGLTSYHKIYFQLQQMNYDEFLNYVLHEMKPDDIQNKLICWNQLKIPDVLELMEKKINLTSDSNGRKARYPAIDRKGKDIRQSLSVLYSKVIGEHEKEYMVMVSLVLDGKLNAFFRKWEGHNTDNLMHIVFITEGISDFQYQKYLRQNQAIVVTIDGYDIESLKHYEMFVPGIQMDEDDEKFKFMNCLTEVMVRKLNRMQQLVLKEILQRNFDIEQVGRRFFSTNAGVWNYQYPLRRALAFEEMQLELILKDLSKKHQQIDILDINMTGANYGIRLSKRADHVVSADVANGCVQLIEKILEKYNKDRIDKIENVKTAIIRPNNFSLLLEGIPNKTYDLIVLGLGSGSYLDNLKGFLRTACAWLKEDGRLLLSVYNKDALCGESLNLENMDFTYNGKEFKHRGSKWEIAANLYSLEEIRKMVYSSYAIDAVFSYPTILSIVSEHQDKKVLNYLKEIDKQRAMEERRGMFNIICASKDEHYDVIQCFNDMRAMLVSEGIHFDEIHHNKIISLKSMKQSLEKVKGMSDDHFIKSVILYDKKNKFWFFVLLPLNKQFHKKYLMGWYSKQGIEQVTRGCINFVEEWRFSELSLASGSISPFAYPFAKKIILEERGERAFLFYDKQLTKLRKESIFTYSGNLEMTWKISKVDFLNFIRQQEGIMLEI